VASRVLVYRLLLQWKDPDSTETTSFLLLANTYMLQINFLKTKTWTA